MPNWTWDDFLHAARMLTRDTKGAGRVDQYANSADGQRAIAATGRTVPSLRLLVESPAFLVPDAKPRNSRVFLSEVPFIRAVPVTAGGVDVEDLAGEELARAYYGRASVDEAIASAIQRAAAFFAPSPTR